MAYYAALVSLVQLLDDIVCHDRYPNLPLTRQTIIKSLHGKFSSLEAALQDYSSRGNEANDRVEGRIRDVAYRAQDVVELTMSDQIKGIQGRDDEKYVEDLEMVLQEIDLILPDVMSIKERQRLEGLKLYSDSADHIGAFEQVPIGHTMMVGFDECLTTIKDQLCGQSSRLRVIPIVGMAGIGKTTLARNIFDDTCIMYHFDCRVWVTISQDYHEDKVVLNILKSIGGESRGEEDLRSIGGESRGEEDVKLKERIYKHLKERRFLFIFDDVWSTKLWDDLKWIFPDDCSGSRIILTTRLLDVAHSFGTVDFIHEMRFLDEDQSWYLLQKKVFAQTHCPPELEHTGKFIARKCHGLPLAIVVIAGILSRVRTLSYWKKIATDVIGILSTSDEHLYSILFLSYNHLSHQLKACFLYMGSFPEDYNINIPKLIKLWSAERFLKPTDESESLERVGEKCLVELVKRNLVLITKKRSNGQFKFCVLHDVLRDFCQRRAAYECFFHVMDKEGYLYPRGLECVRHMNVDFNHPCQCGPYYAGKLVRSILCFGEKPWLDFKNIEWNSYKLFRVVDLPNIPKMSTLMAISNMFNLMYLGLYLECYDFRFHLPQFMTVFQNLQTLVIDNARLQPIILPPQIWNMTQLSHLIIGKMILPAIPMLALVQKLGCLKTLMKTINFKFTPVAIDMISNLRKLKIECRGDSTKPIWELYCLYELFHLSQLEELKITFIFLDYLPFVNFPCGFAFPPNLRKLSLQGCRLPWKDMTMVEMSLPNLQVLRLREDSFVGEEWEPIEGQFHRLKFLLLEKLDLKCWQAENIHFPCLEHLEIKYCNKLEKIPIEIGDIPALKCIHLFESRRAEASAMLIREEQQNLGNDEIEVHVVHC